MPRRMGGGGRRQAEDLERTSRMNGGSLLSGGPDTEIGLLHRVIALMIREGLRTARSRALRSDARKLSDVQRPVTMPDGTVLLLSPLERWERLLGLRPAPDATVTARREAVRFWRGLAPRNDAGALAELLAQIFGDVAVDVQRLQASDIGASAAARWPGATGSGGYPGQLPSGTAQWMSEIARFAYLAHTDDIAPEERDRLMAFATLALEQVLPAFAYPAGATT